MARESNVTSSNVWSDSRIEALTEVEPSVLYLENRFLRLLLKSKDRYLRLERFYHQLCEEKLRLSLNSAAKKSPQKLQTSSPSHTDDHTNCSRKEHENFAGNDKKVALSPLAARALPLTAEVSNLKETLVSGNPLVAPSENVEESSLPAGQRQSPEGSTSYGSVSNKHNQSSNIGHSPQKKIFYRMVSDDDDDDEMETVTVNSGKEVPDVESRKEPLPVEEREDASPVEERKEVSPMEERVKVQPMKEGKEAEKEDVVNMPEGSKDALIGSISSDVLMALNLIPKKPSQLTSQQTPLQQYLKRDLSVRGPAVEDTNHHVTPVQPSVVYKYSDSPPSVLPLPRPPQAEETHPSKPPKQARSRSRSGFSRKRKRDRGKSKKPMGTSEPTVVYVEALPCCIDDCSDAVYSSGKDVLDLISSVVSPSRGPSNSKSSRLARNCNHQHRPQPQLPPPEQVHGFLHSEEMLVSVNESEPMSVAERDVTAGTCQPRSAEKCGDGSGKEEQEEAEVELSCKDNTVVAAGVARGKEEVTDEKASKWADTLPVTTGLHSVVSMSSSQSQKDAPMPPTGPSTGAKRPATRVEDSSQTRTKLKKAMKEVDMAIPLSRLNVTSFSKKGRRISKMQSSTSFLPQHDQTEASSILCTSNVESLRLGLRTFTAPRLKMKDTTK